MIRTLIVEDEFYIRKSLTTMISNLNEDIEILGECESVKEAIIVAHATKPDLILLDINLKDGNAFDFLEQTKELPFKVVFITAYEQYALRALKNGAIDYILKPVDIEEFEKAIEKVIKSEVNTNKKHLKIVEEQLINKIKEKLVIHTQQGYQVINYRSITYCESDKGYTSFYLSDGKTFIASRSLKEFESQLPHKKFRRTHQSFIVNMDYVDRYDKNGYVFLVSGKQIPVASRRKNDFVDHLLEN